MRTNQTTRRKLEFLGMICTTIVLLLLARLETRIFSLGASLGKDREFVSTIAYFALVNLNVILILALGYLVFRNLTKLLIERKRGVIGSRLKTKLVLSLVFFALTPALLTFYISSRFVMGSFETWFSDKVRFTLQETRKAGNLVYLQDQRRMQSLAKIATERITVFSGEGGVVGPSSLDVTRLRGFIDEYGLSTVRIFDVLGTQLWSSDRGRGSLIPKVTDPYIDQTILKFLEDPLLPSLGTVSQENQRDMVKGVAPIRDSVTGKLLVVVMTTEYFPTQILRGVEDIMTRFSILRPGAQTIQLSHIPLMVLITVLIVFAATWMGFYVARVITGPIHKLADATREVALGNYGVKLLISSDDETGQLIKSFNLMTDDLREHRRVNEQTKMDLRRSNEELGKQKQTLEMVLRNISSGVVSVDSNGLIMTANAAACRLLEIPQEDYTGQALEDVLGKALTKLFWQKIQSEWSEGKGYIGELDLTAAGIDVLLLVHAHHLQEQNSPLTLIVFDDASEQLGAQKVAAWKEVARRIAHEVKNPITPIKLSAQRLLRKFHNRFDGDDLEVFEGCMRTIISQTDSLRDLVNEFSNFARLPEVALKKGDVNAIVKEVCELYRQSYPEIAVEFDPMAVNSQVRVDPEQFRRALVNLASNAYAALPDDRAGQIRFSTAVSTDGGFSIIEVSDNGCGIPKELRSRILEPYFSTKDEGTGLGLAIVNQIVSDHGGALKCISIENEGTRMLIHLPLIKPKDSQGEA